MLFTCRNPFIPEIPFFFFLSRPRFGRVTVPPASLPHFLSLLLIIALRPAPLAIFGPAATTWFKILQTRIQLSNANATIVARVAADQLLFAPTNLFIFLNTMALLEGSDARKKLESTYKPALQKNWMVWPFVQMINFKFVPLELRVLVVNVISLGWNCYLSWVNSQSAS